MMLAVVVAWSVGHGRWPGWSHVAGEALFVQNYAPAIFPHTWSLAVEEHFYLLLPPLLLCFRGQKERPFAALPAVFASVAIGCLALRVAGAWGQEQAVRASFAPTHLRIDSLLFGVLLSWLAYYRGAQLRQFVRRWRWWMFALAITLAAPAFAFELAPTWYLFTFGFSALYLASGLLLLLALHHPVRRGALAWIGFYSYSIYLWHIAVERILLPAILPRDVGPLLRLAAYLPASIAAGVLAAWVVELPFLRLRDRWFPSRSQTMPREIKTVA
jgi:peptidoglycan/LPS O-acetylase OafA/YrhL